MTKCAIVVPCFNEASRLESAAFLEQVQLRRETDLVLVNDASQDRTQDIPERLQEQQPARFQVMNLSRNVGKAEAVRQGVLAALQDRPEFVGYWDADLATPLEAIDQMRAVLEENPAVDMVLGSRVRLLGRSIDRRPLRHYLGRVFATAASCVLGVPVYDTQCGAKLMRASDEIAALFAAPFCSRWIFDVELLARYLRGRRGHDEPAAGIYELPLKQWRDVPGSKLRPWDCLKALFDLARIAWRYRRPRRLSLSDRLSVQLDRRAPTAVHNPMRR